MKNKHIRRLLLWTSVIPFDKMVVMTSLPGSQFWATDISQVRHPYHGLDGVFDVEHLASKQPFHQFKAWFDEAMTIPEIHEANAMSLATATKDGVPSVRVVLLKAFDHEGFKFFTNYESRKGQELTANPRCSLMFYWEPQKRCVRIDGVAERLTTEESVNYFDSRPRDSRLGAMVSRQSTVIPDRESLNKQLGELSEQYSNPETPIEKPIYWGGFRVRPITFEFWQGQTNRLHDRILFRKLGSEEKFNPDLMAEGEDEWIIERLSP